MTAPARIVLWSLCTILAASVEVRAQQIGSEPVSIGGGRMTIGGSASASMSSDEDAPFWFNYTGYEHNTLRTIRLALQLAANAGSHVTFLGEVRTENWDTVRPYALYVRIRPWTKKAFDIQAGQIPPVFGTFARRSYETDNPLIGYPLAYQYLTSLRSDALPSSVDDLVAMRGSGWQVVYPLGNGVPDEGLPLVNPFRWDTGVEVKLGSEPVTLSAAVTTGTLSDPKFIDDNAGKQVSARLGIAPWPGFVLGVSAASGAYLNRSLASSVSGDIDDFAQRAIGFDAEYSRDYWIVRAEAVFNIWEMPSSPGSGLPGRLRADGFYVEGKYKLAPGLYVAARADRLSFSDVTSSGGRVSWDAPVTRLEIGGGYSIFRNLLGKLVYQRNRRDLDPDESLDMVAAQILFWF